jgi:hypothetical protein
LVTAQAFNALAATFWGFRELFIEASSATFDTALQLAWQVAELDPLADALTECPRVIVVAAAPGCDCEQHQSKRSESFHRVPPLTRTHSLIIAPEQGPRYVL